LIVVGITGWKNAGKTTLTEKLVAHFVQRGLKVATVKHAHHAFDIDHEGTDSWRHRKAGAQEVAIVSSNRWAVMHELENEKEPPLQDVIARLSPCDIVFVEGYKRAGHSKIEVRRGLTAEKLAQSDASIFAIAADHDIHDCPLPVFDLNDVAGIAEVISAQFSLIKLTQG
jgi:molybdopterin-guanine dinucleotide biosynthesis adapter protein